MRGPLSASSPAGPLAALLCIALLAGCSDPAPTAQAIPTASPTGHSSATATLAATIVEEKPNQLVQEYALESMEVTVDGARTFSPTENCLALGEVLLAGGKAKVTWSSSLPFLMELVLYDGQQAIAARSGTSPVELDLPIVPIGERGTPYIAWQVAKDQPAGAAPLVQGTLAVDLAYSGSMEPGTDSCTVLH